MSSSPAMPRRGMEVVEGTDSLPHLLMTFPLALPHPEIAGLVARAQSPTEEVLMLSSRPGAPTRVIARLLAILLLDDSAHIMHTMFMPSRPAVAHLLVNGEVREGRGKKLGPWAEREIERLASVLEREHRSYLLDVATAISGGSGGGFGGLPGHFVFSDPTNTARLGPPPPQLDVDESESEASLHELKWYHIVELDYRRNRYLAHLTEEGLTRRIEDIMGNAHIVDGSGLISLDASDLTLRYWLARLSEVKAEMELRHGPYPAGWRRGMIDRANLPGSLAATGPKLERGLTMPSPPVGEYLVRYSSLAFVEALLREGRLRLNPASSYGDSSLNTAIRDDELNRVVDFDPYSMGVPPIWLSPGALQPGTRLHAVRRINTDFYVYCLTRSLSSRLLLDFRAEAGLVIRDPDEFVRRLTTGVSARLPEWKCVMEHVEYYDPLQVNPVEIEVVSWKHFRYAYQQEVRLAWTPPKRVANLEPIDLSIGSVEDIAEIVLPVFVT